MRKLRLYFLLFAILLAIPLTLLLWRAYSTLEQETFFFYRGIAESRIAGVQDRIRRTLSREELRPFTQYRYLHVAQRPVARQVGLNLSPLASFPVESEIPGILGYFQIDPDGSFHSPILPYAEQDPELDVPQRPLRETLKRELASIVQITPVSSRAQAPAETGEEGDAGAGAESFRRELAKQVNPQLNYQYESELGQDRDTTGSESSSQRDAIQTQKSFPAQSRVFDNKVPEASYAVASKEKQSASGEKADSRSAAGVGARLTPQRLDGLGVGLDETETSAEVDALEARVVDGRWLVFSRNVWWLKRRYVQGFVADLGSFVDSYLAPTTAASGRSIPISYLVFHAQQQVSTSPHTARGGDDKPVLLLTTPLPHPLADFRVAAVVPAVGVGAGRGLLHLLGLYLVILVSGGLCLIYRLAATQVELSRKKSDFVSAVSHELRTPLSTIRMYGEMLMEGWVEGEEKKQDYYRHIHDESERLSRLIENVLRLAQLERDEWEVSLQEQDPAALVQEVASLVEDRIRRAGFELRVKVEGSPEAISVDRDALTQVLINLIDNSIKFARNAATKRIDLTISQAGAACSIQVRDFGPGIPAAKLKKIFQKFYRIDGEMTRTTRGTGIGLALVKMLSDRMGARVDVVSRRPGVEFNLLFPTGTISKASVGEGLPPARDAG